ncbi:MAG TPA: hypothetical protein PLZ12_11145 [Saprospiraceae bacterium]|nr:hypothetical protein [Saprospiraceae bacterium]
MKKGHISFWEIKLAPRLGVVAAHGFLGKPLNSRENIFYKNFTLENQLLVNHFFSYFIFGTISG